MKDNNLVYRSIGTFEQVDEENSRVIRGVAIVFDSLSRVMRDEKGYTFVEKVSRDAITEDFLASQDVIMNIDHDNSKLLARYNKGEGTLRLFLAEDGLHFEFEAPQTALGDEVLYNVRNNNLFECSFACIIKDGDIVETREDGMRIHTIQRISALLDCSIVCHAAYPETEVEARSLMSQEIEAEEEAKKAAAEAEEQEKRNQEILANLESLRTEFLDTIA